MFTSDPAIMKVICAIVLLATIAMAIPQPPGPKVARTEDDDCDHDPSGHDHSGHENCDHSGHDHSRHETGLAIADTQRGNPKLRFERYFSLLNNLQ